jgi:hypothetical protein
MATTLLFSAATDRWRLDLLTRQAAPEKDLATLRTALSGQDGTPQARWTCDTPAHWAFPGVPTEADAKSTESINAPVVFENRQYLLRIRREGGATLVGVSHPWSREINDSLDIDDNSCYATLRTGNDIGRFSLEIETEAPQGGRHIDRITWQVWPLKLDYGKDLQSISNAVERKYPLWLYRFLAPTDHEAGRSDTRQDRFLLLWLKQFEALQQRLEDGVRTVIRSPHQRLDEHVHHLRPDRIQGKMPPRLEEKVAEGLYRPERRHRVASRRSSFDTPENRFVKHTVGQVAARLNLVDRVIEEMLGKDREDQCGVTGRFWSRVKVWRRSVRSQASSPLFRAVGDFEGLNQESLVLHNRSGYSAVYRAWLELRHYLEFFAKVRSTNIGMRQISELYELWCFLELRSVLRSLGFRDETTLRHPGLWKKSELETALENGFGAAYLLRHERAGINIRLAHEPVFGKVGTENIHSYTVSQKPDIVLEATWPDGQRLLWIFDAKYRVKSFRDGRDDGRSESQPLVPPDALDQMHRYRDSLILRYARDDEKSRPVIGAYALYPGVFDQATAQNPYGEAIREVGIGAFPLLPRSGHDHWLREHLRVALGLYMANPDEALDPSTLLARENVRIPVTGLEYRDEVLVVPLDRDRSPDYVQAFATGTAKGYHIDVLGGPDPRRLGATRWFAAITSFEGRREIRGLYRIQSCETCRRSSLSESVSGAHWSRDRDVHWLQLDRWIQLREPIVVTSWMGGNWFRYFERSLLEKARDFKELGAVA